MIKLVWTSLRNSKLRSFLFICALISILVFSTLNLQTLLNVQAQINDDISQYARGTYDLLVRPKNSQRAIEKTLGVVEENYLGTGDGGITIETWKKIKELDGIEIAAPVSALGYFTGFSQSFELPLPEDSSIFNVSFSTTDGVNEYKYGKESKRYYLAQDNYYGGYDHFVDSNYIGSVVSGEPPQFMIPQTFHLLVGIDLKEEQKLTGIPFLELDRELKPSELSLLTFAKNTPIIKVLYLKDAQIPVKAHVTQKVIPWDSEDTIALKKEGGLSSQDMLNGLENKEQIFSLLNGLKPLSETTYLFDFSNYITPFYFEALAFDYEGNKTSARNYATGMGESSVYYTISPIQYEIDEEYLTVEQIGKEFEVPTYRSIEKHGLPAYRTSDIPFLLVPINAFTAKEYQKSLAASPLGIYHQAPTTTKEGTIVHETALPGSFISAPAHGLISIEDTVHIKGNAPIDAIRIKISNITSYNKEAENKILHIVKEIHQLGDFHIDIVAGASPKTIKMDVEGIGMLTQQWTSLGAATKITEGWSITNLVISILFILVGISYILNSMFFRKNLKHSETALLMDIGWTKKYITYFQLLELVILTLIASLCSFSVIILLIYLQLLDSFSLLLFVSVFLLVFSIILITSLVPQKSTSTKKQKTRGKTMFIRNLLYYKKFIVLTFIQLSMVTMLLFFVVTSIDRTFDFTGETNLGSFINNTILLSLLIVIIVTVSLALSTIIESNTSFLSLRKTELQNLRDIGWKHSNILSLCLKESGTWTFLSILLGAVVSLIILAYFYSFTLTMIGQAIVIILFLYSLVLLTSFLVIRNHIKKI